MLHILKRDPRYGYYDSALWLPQSHYAEQQLRGTLTYELKSKRELYQAFSIEKEHYIVPRNYIDAAALSKLPFPVIDARIQRFPRVRVKSKVTLDYKNPEETHQREGAKALIRSNNGVLCLRCGSGKTIVSIHAFTELQVPGLVIVNDLGLAEQWIDEILEFTDLTEGDIGFCGGGTFTWQKPITVALAQTLAGRVRDGRLPHEMISHFGVTIADEAHNTAGPAFYHLATTPFHGRRWGLSATPYRSDQFRSLMHYTLGRVVYKYLTPELTPLIYFRRLPTRLDLRDLVVRNAVCDVTGELHLSKLYAYLATRDDRTNMIAEEIQNGLNQNRQILVLSQSREMLERLAARFPQAGVVHGGVKDRKERRRRIKECNPVIAISKLGRQALNKPVLDTLLVCEPYTDAGVLQQLLGRVQRSDPNKQQPIAVFYEDVYIDRLRSMCMKIRSLFGRWPDEMGGRMRWQNVGVEP